MQHHDPDQPVDPNEVWASVMISAEEIGEVHTHDDGTEHQEHVVTIAIENHGLPYEKFVDTLIMAAVTVLKTSIAAHTFGEGVPEQARDAISDVMAREYLRHRLGTKDLPTAELAFSLPNSLDDEEG